MNAEEYQRYDAIGLAKLIRGGEVTALEVVQIAIEQIENLNPSLNAVIAKLYDAAIAQAEKGTPGGPLGGVPFVLKDLNTFCVGAPATQGCYAFKDFFPQRDSALVSRYRAGGLIILGKTNTPELGLNIATEPSLFGATRNPIDATKSPGGSSGGSAAAVASGMLPAAHATDSGGSIRIPASNCGLYGLKPTRARVPLGNDAAEGLAGFSTVNSVSHSVRDNAMLLDIAAGGLAGDAYAAPAKRSEFVDSLSQPITGTRIALWTAGYADEFVAADCKAVAHDVAAKCETLGCTVDEQRPDIDGAGLREAFDVLFCGNIRALVTSVMRGRANTSESLFEPATLACSEYGARYGAADYAAAVQTVHKAGRVMGLFFEKYDILITPTLANPPLPMGALSMRNDNWPDYLDALLNEIPFTPLFNATGCPAASIPLGTSVDGLPVGVQLGAALGQEDVILRLSSALESNWSWHHRI